MRAGALLVPVLLATGVALAADEPAEAEPRSTGLPWAKHWTFNFDAGLGLFGFAHSLYTDARPDPSGNLSDDWAEGYVKPALSFEFGLKKGTLYGKLSGIGVRTFSAPPSVVGEEASSFKAEDLYIGWKSGIFDVSAGRAPYAIGHGMLIWDGAGDGGSRGGFWSAVRKAWGLAGIARVKPGHHTIEGFYVQRDDLPEAETESDAWGVNYEYAWGDTSTFGGTYARWSADPAVVPHRDGMDLYNIRAYTAPFRSLRALEFEVEYALERNGDLIDSTAWTAQAAYELSAVSGSPRLSYRHAEFEGDDPATNANEAFDPLYPGFYDWGSWWQGEIAGEYIVANSNLVSDQLRVHLAPKGNVETGLIAYLFHLDRLPPIPGVTSKDLAFEIDGYCDWSINDNFSASFVAAYADPQRAVQQLFGRNDPFYYGMIYLSYSY